MCLFLVSAFGSDLKIVPASSVTKGQVVQLIPEEIKAECVYTGVTQYPPWLEGRDPPWETPVRIQDVYNRNDQWLSMAIDATGKIYVCYTTPWTNVGTSPRYGWGIATSTDNGLTWDNRVWRIASTTYSMLNPEIAISEDGKIWVWGTLNTTPAPVTPMVPAFMKSKQNALNNPDSLAGVYFFRIANRFYSECLTRGLSNQLVFTQYTVDQTGANDSVCCFFSEDSGATGWYYFNFRPPGGNPGMTSIGDNYNGMVDILIHGIEYYDGTGADYDVVCYLDTLQSASGNLYGWATGNTLNDRYSTVFCDNGYAYIGMQSDVGAGNNDILFNYSTDFGATWNASLIDITNDAGNETYPKLFGFASTIGADYIYGGNTVRFNHSIWYGQNGTWQATPEIVTDGTTANNTYRSVAGLYTPNYLYSIWEDNRNFSTDSIEIYSARRTPPIGIEDRNFSGIANAKIMPNPFKNSVHIYLQVSNAQNINLTVYDVQGRKVRTLVNVTCSSNNISAIWDGKDDYGKVLSSGIYFLRVDSEKNILNKNLILLK